ncbi:hypothetical protein [Paenibacillus sp. P32E]|uniref:hypothetical protein n=1 Tax=Paenibacillus sp. P32E TaxID=1349434 RepID=UPI00093A955D|nr:hypothetical protein [Paenibacillus sp. P32E]OKP91301.1 hypothetical protein A3848_09340 [Paenibacillus sp. P32E]
MTPERFEKIKKVFGQVGLLTGPMAVELMAALEEAEKRKVELWECEDCGFSFNAIHTDFVDGKDSGDHSCPLCAETRLEKELAEAQRIIDRHEQENERKQKFIVEQAEYSNEIKIELREAQQTIARKREALEKIKSTGAQAGNNSYYHMAKFGLGEGAKEL